MIYKKMIFGLLLAGTVALQADQAPIVEIGNDRIAAAIMGWLNSAEKDELDLLSLALLERYVQEGAELSKLGFAQLIERLQPEDAAELIALMQDLKSLIVGFKSLVMLDATEENAQLAALQFAGSVQVILMKYQGLAQSIAGRQAELKSVKEKGAVQLEYLSGLMEKMFDTASSMLQERAGKR